MVPQNGWEAALIEWYEAVKRDLPWRRTRDPYAVWISEIMLQQTRVEAVISYYHRFLQAFPTVQALAAAPEEAVLKAWEGLGYYSRARNIHKTAKIVADTLAGAFPHTAAQLKALPGIGDYTSGAIASIAFDESVPAIDGNVKRVTSRLFGIRENINRPTVITYIRETLTHAIPTGKASAFNQALMELGAMVCIPHVPRCDTCPLTEFCDAYAADDADTLPVMEPKKPPLSLAITVCLMTYESKILVFQRKEKLLHNLYVFGLAEDISDAEEAQLYWMELGLELQYIQDLGEARHVFTHRIWEMRILHFQLLKQPDAAFLHEHNAKLVDLAQLKTLPLPTAMKAANEAAMKLL